ncbi:response regulator transcription factor [Streptomyces sp. NBC_01518]|uniref:response regulator n=1 Tax=Streptomyces sp. NBC_01518 TaxID=2903891 RepID=UPI00386C87A0
MVVDDQAVVRAGFAAIVDAEPDLTVIGEAGDGATAVSLAAREAPDLVLMDIRMPGMDGLTATRLITALESRPRVLVLTTFDLDVYVYEALRAGSSGFLLKDAQPEDLLAAIRVVAAGDGILAPAVTRRLIDTFAQGAPPPPTVTGALGQLTPVMFFAVLQEGRWPPGPAWLFPPVEPMTWGVVPPGPRGAVGDADERPDYRPAERNARHLVGGRSA